MSTNLLSGLFINFRYKDDLSEFATMFHVENRGPKTLMGHRVSC